MPASSVHRCTEHASDRSSCRVGRVVPRTDGTTEVRRCRLASIDPRPVGWSILPSVLRSVGRSFRSFVRSFIDRSIRWSRICDPSFGSFSSFGSPSVPLVRPSVRSLRSRLPSGRSAPAFRRSFRPFFWNDTYCVRSNAKRNIKHLFSCRHFEI